MLEQGLKTGIDGYQLFGMPLYGVNIARMVFHGLDYIVGRCGRDRKTWGNFGDSLMVVAVDINWGIAAQQAAEQGVGGQCDMVGQAASYAHILGMADGAGPLGGEVLAQGTAEAYVDELHPAADAEYWQFAFCCLLD